MILTAAELSLLVSISAPLGDGQVAAPDEPKFELSSWRGWVQATAARFARLAGGSAGGWYERG